MQWKFNLPTADREMSELDRLINMNENTLTKLSTYSGGLVSARRHLSVLSTPTINRDHPPVHHTISTKQPSSTCPKLPMKSRGTSHVRAFEPTVNTGYIRPFSKFTTNANISDFEAQNCGALRINVVPPHSVKPTDMAQTSIDEQGADKQTTTAQLQSIVLEVDDGISIRTTEFSRDTASDLLQKVSHVEAGWEGLCYTLQAMFAEVNWDSEMPWGATLGSYLLNARLKALNRAGLEPDNLEDVDHLLPRLFDLLATASVVTEAELALRCHQWLERSQNQNDDCVQPENVNQEQLHTFVREELYKDTHYKDTQALGGSEEETPTEEVPILVYHEWEWEQIAQRLSDALSCIKLQVCSRLQGPFLKVVAHLLYYRCKLERLPTARRNTRS